MKKDDHNAAISKKDMELLLKAMEMRIDQKMEKRLKENTDEVTTRVSDSERHLLFAMEHLQNDVNDMYHDKISVIDGKMDNHDKRIKILEKRSGLAVA